MKTVTLAVMAFIVLAFPTSALCADLHLPGSELGLAWVVPFAGMLLSIAICPLLVPHFWEKHFGKVALGWSLAFLVPCALVFGPSVALFEAWHALSLDYIPFILLLLALFTVAGGVRLGGRLVGTPQVNVLLLLVGTFLASFMGTTGTAMLLIRPLLRANSHRKYKAHSVIFFIFLVANIGGCLTPLGDPPLFLGFLKGVSFFWTTTHLLPILLVEAVLLLVLYYILESYFYKKEGRPTPPELKAGDDGARPLYLEGKINLLLLLGIVVAVLASGSFDLGGVTVNHVEIAWQSVLRDSFMVVVALLSLKLTPESARKGNGFTWGPIMEVGKLFFGIFLSMIPALAILRAGADGALSSVIGMTTQNGQPVNYMYFWLTGALSSFLDNAPTYLVFFNAAGGDAANLMGPMATTLTAISAGAVFMGANTYIGNAPNFMVRSIAESEGVNMPSFFGYMLWSGCILVPSFVLLTFLFIA